MLAHLILYQGMITVEMVLKALERLAIDVTVLLSHLVHIGILLQPHGKTMVILHS